MKKSNLELVNDLVAIAQALQRLTSAHYPGTPTTDYEDLWAKLSWTRQEILQRMHKEKNE